MPNGTRQIDLKTGRPYGDHGTAQDAVSFLLKPSVDMAPGDEILFLRAWNEGALDEWPEYYEWLKLEGR